MFRRDIFVLQFAGFLIRQVDDPFHTRGNEDLSSSTPKDTRLGTGLKDIVQPFLQDLGIDLQDFENLQYNTLGLLNQCQQDVFSIYLIMPIALDNIRCSLRRLLGSFCKSVKSHHSCLQ